MGRTKAFKILMVGLGFVAVGVLFQNCGNRFGVLNSLGQEISIPLALEFEASSFSSQKESMIADKKGSTLYSLALNSTRVIKQGLMNREWILIRDRFRSFVQGARTNNAVLYDAQMELSNFVQYAFKHSKTNWLHDLMSIYLEANLALQYKSEYIFSYPELPDGTTPSRKALPLTQAYPMWLEDNSEESVLTSAQFLYPITLILFWIEKTGVDKRDSVAKEFSDKYSNVATAHIRRWVLKEGSNHGVFQMRGWDCNSGTFSHIEYLTHLKARHFGTSHFPSFKNYSYCNVVLDSDLFILASVMHILAAKKISSFKYDLPQSALTQLNEYLILGAELFKSRISRNSATNFIGETVPTVNFDLGSFDDYKDYEYAGDTNSSFPGWVTPSISSQRSPKPSVNVGWDISHARRFVLFLFSLREFGVNQGIISNDELSEIENGMANQLAYVVFNRSYEFPAFANYMDGTNGWFRVNYSNRSGFGYEPWSAVLGESIVLGGYGFWGQFNRDLDRILIAAERNLKYDEGHPFYLLQAYSAMPDSFFSGGKRRR